jgi:HK97 family phage major capsid protein
VNNRTILEKADLALSDLITGGGYLQPAQAKKFLRLLGRESVLLGQVQLVPMRAPKQEVSKVALSQRILRPGAEATALTQAERAKPDFSKVELDAKLFKAEVRLSDEQLEDNIEGGDLRQTVMELIASAVARDMEEIAIQGDTSSPDPFLATMDGVLRQATSHVVDAGGGTLSGDVLLDLLKAIPSHYLRAKRDMRFYTAINAEIDYRRTLQQRETDGGDRMIESDAPVSYQGVPVAPIPLFPEHLGAAANETNVLFAHPKNLAVGVWRQIRIETAREISEGVLKVVVTLRFDTKIVDELACAKAIHVTAS